MKTLPKVLTAAVLAGLLIPGATQARRDRVDFADGVTFNNADTSPLPPVSNIDNYIYQDEQINVDPRDGTVKVLRTDQKVVINQFVTALIPIANALPRELRGPIRTMVRKEGGEADVVQDKESGRNYMHVVCPEFQLPFVRQVVEGLDAQWVEEREDGSAELYYVGKFRDIRNIQNITRFYIGPEGMGRFFFDDLNNAMYYTDQPALMGLQTWGLSQVDIPPNHVLLDVAVYEVDTNNDTMIGVDWAAWLNGPGRFLFEFDYFVESDDIDITNTATDKLEGIDFDRTFSYITFNAINASQFFDYVQNKGYVRELVKTQIAVKSGDPALVEAVDAVAHFASESNPDTRTEVTLADKQGDEVTAILPEERNRLLHYREAGDKVGVQIEVVPYIGLESMELSIDVDVSSVNGYTPSGNPILGVRSVSDYVRLVDGQPFVLGGVERETIVRRKNGFPVLHKLPVIGWLFGNEVNAKRDTRIVVIVTPQFDVKAESDLAMPVEMATIRALAEGEIPLEIPENPFGFDQWLMD